MKRPEWQQGSRSWLRERLSTEPIRAGVSLLILASVSLAAYTPWLGLVGDDWWYFAHLSDGQFLSAALYENPARPVVVCVWLALWRGFGLHIWLYYIANFIVQWLTALMIFTMLRSIFYWGVVDAVTAAALFLLYPADTAHVYLSVLATRVCVLMVIVGAILWLRAWKEERATPMFGVGLALMALSLFIYETPLLLIALLPSTLPIILWRGRRLWLRYALSCYGVCAAYLMFRLGVAYAVSRRGDAFYVSFRLTPAWLLAQLQALPAATIWNGWFYALKVLWDFGPWVSLLGVVSVVAFLLAALRWVQKGAADVPRVWWKNLGLSGAGAALSAAAVAPVVVSSFSLEHAVGTLGGRFVHGAALGHAILIIGLCALPGSLLPLGSRRRILLRNALVVLFLTIALLGALGVQRGYVQAWRVQLGLIHSLQEQASSFQDGTTIVLLDVPSGAFDARFYYPLTQLVRRFYGNSTLHVLPWQRGFPPDRQLVAFGQESAVALVEVVQKDVMTFYYERMVAFQVGAGGDLQAVREIDYRYLCGEHCERLPFSIPAGWKPAQEPFALNDVQNRALINVPPATAWREFLSAQWESAHCDESP